MRTLHNHWAYIVVASNLVVGIWGLWLWRRRGSAPRAYWISLGIAWTTIFIQGAMGLWMFETYRPPFRHHFYGFLFVIIMLMVFPMRTEAPRRTVGIFAGATLFIGIVAVRAMLSI